MSQETIHQSKPLDSLVLLRGIAVILVCFDHYCAPLTDGHFLSTLFEFFDDYGGRGVQVFFVISGFVIPLSLFKGKYTINDYGRFLYKRLLRLHPPYIVALALTLIIMFLAFKVRNMPFPEDIETITKSFFYLHIPRDNPVFWTLIVEAQYYLFIGLFFPLLMRFPNLVLFIAIPLILAASKLAFLGNNLFFSSIGYFLIGTVTFLIYTKSSNQKLNFLALLYCFAFAAFFYKFPAVIVASLTVAAILLYNFPVSKILQFPGKISYSIYLIHFPLGIKLINLLKPSIPPTQYWLLFIFVMTFVFVSSWIFYKLIEDFSEKISRKIKYKAAHKQELVTNKNRSVAVAN